MALTAPQQQISKVLSATGLTDVFCVYPSVEQATSGRRPAADL
jgi:anti-anti-sigma regulatory factor